MLPRQSGVPRRSSQEGCMTMRQLPILVATFAIGVAVSCGCGIAQTAGDKATATQIITLGTRGGPQPSKDRAQSSNLLIVNGTLYLIDAGDGVTRRIVQAGHDYRKVGKIFI